MEARREQIWVGLFVLVAGALLVTTVFALSGVFGRAGIVYHAQFPYAGGLEPGATVRYAGGPKVGRVEQLRIAPQNPSQIEITFSVKPEVPVKVDSKVKILSLSPLGENFLEISPGTPQAPRAKSGSLLPSEPYVDFNAITAQLNELGPSAKRLLDSLNDRASELQVTITRVNDLLSAENRANLSGTLANVRGMLEENRPRVRATLAHVDEASAKVAPLLDDLKKTMDKADQTLAHIDAMIGDNRADVHQAIVDLRKTLASTASLTSRLDRTFEVNGENIDELLENLRLTSENLKAFTDTIKARPYTLIRVVNPPEHKPGGVK